MHWARFLLVDRKISGFRAPKKEKKFGIEWRIELQEMTDGNNLWKIRARHVPHFSSTGPKKKKKRKKRKKDTMNYPNPTFLCCPPPSPNQHQAFFVLYYYTFLIHRSHGHIPLSFSTFTFQFHHQIGKLKVTHLRTFLKAQSPSSKTTFFSFFCFPKLELHTEEAVSS